jgi:hypothetical protein
LTSSKRQQRKDQFRKLGAALSTLDNAWAVRKAEFQYEIRPRAVADHELTSRLYGPVMKTQQFKSTVYMDVLKPA